MKKRFSLMDYGLSMLLLASGFAWFWLWKKHQESEVAWGHMAGHMKMVAENMEFDDMVAREFPDWGHDASP